MFNTSVGITFLRVLITILLFSNTCISNKTFGTDKIQFANKDFVLHKQKLSWNEALSLCQSLDSHLAVVNDLSLVNHLIDAVKNSASQNDYDKMWIGGQHKGGKWIWRPTGKEIRSQDGFPVWDSVTKIKHSCLLLDHKNSHLAFLNQDCGTKHTFICEKIHEAKVLVEDEFQDNDHKYSFYKAPVTWDKAVATCRENGSYLAVISSVKEVKLLSTFLSSSVLNLKWVWLGGRSEGGVWQWVNTGDTISGQMSAGNFPPWGTEHIHKVSIPQCLQLSAADGLFQISNCTDMQGFVCEKVQPKEAVERRSFKHNRQLFVIFNRKLSWESAVEACWAENALLSVIEDMETAKLIAAEMTKAWESPQSVWVGAHRTSNNTWEWLATHQQLSHKTNPETGYPPWKRSPVLHGGECLSFERSSENNVHFVQKWCEILQYFICQRDETAVVAVVKEVVIGDRNFTIHEKPEVWDRAIDICKQENSHLAVLRDIDEVNFLNRYSSVRQLWLGGRYVAGIWQWLELGEKIPMEQDDEGFPLWNRASRHPKNRTDCLLLDLRKNDTKFAGMFCNKKLGFLCEKMLKIQDTYISEDRAYIVYNQRVTWQEAAAICRSKGYHLAMVSDLQQAQFLSSLTREHYELWLGGIVRDGNWEWDHTGQEIPPEPERSNYPPWISVPTLPGHNCLSIDRAKSGAPVFVDTQCDAALSFVCETGSGDINSLLEPKVVEYESRMYTFNPQRLTWTEAVESCTELGGTLVTLANTDMVKFIAKESHDTTDVWVGAHFVNGEWHWISSGEIILPRKEGREFPPFARARHRVGHDCLVLSRHNPYRPILVDLPCNSTQAFVCEKADNNTEKLIETVQLQDRMLIFMETRMNFSKAMEVCRTYNGYLATVNKQDLLEIVRNHGKKFGGVWVGAQMDSDSSLRWLHTGQPLPEIAMRSMAMWDEDEEIILSNSYRTNKRILGVKADIPDFIPESAKWNRHSSKTSYTESEEELNTIMKDTNSLSNLTEELVKYQVATHSQNISQKIRGKMKEEVGGGNLTQFTQQNTLSQLVGSVTEQMQLLEKSSALIKSTEMLNHVTEAVTPATKLAAMSREINLTKRKSVSEEPFTTESTPMVSLHHDTASLSRNEHTSEKFNSKVEARICIKLDGRGEIIEVPCSTMHSFVCETRTNETHLIVKHFTFHDRLYGFSTQKVSWEKAANICISNNSYLAVVTSKKEASFIANAGQEFQDLWIGGHYNEEAMLWQWTHTGMNISTAPDEAGFPKWYNLHSRPVHDCLNIYRESPGEAAFVDRECSELHGFVCEGITLYTENGRSISEATNVTYEFAGRSLVFHYHPVTWDEAAELCLSNGSLLATVQSQPELDFFNSISPTLHDIWVGARVRDNLWYWDQLNAVISNVATSAEELSNLQKNFSSMSVPLSKWMSNVTRAGHNCSSVYRDSSRDAHLVDQPCNSLHSFVCEEINRTTVEFEGQKYTFYLQQLNWFEANNFCQQRGQYLTVVNYPREAQFIADVGRVFREVWIGGKMVNENNVGWVWEHTGQVILPDLGSDRFWPWLNSQPISQPDMQCLSVFRPEGRSEMFSDEDCSRSLSFVCEDADASILPQEQAVYFQGRLYTFYSALVTWEEAETICRTSNTYLAVINSLDEAKFIAQNPHGFHDIWVGSKWNARTSRWEWFHTGQIHSTEASFPIGATISKRTNHDCLNLYRDSFQQYMFVDRLCGEKHGFVCEEAGGVEIAYTETYSFETRHYKAYSKAVTWSEASNICLSSGQTLAVINSAALSDFIAHNVSRVFHDLWIGGHFDGTYWKWIHKEKLIPNKLKEGMDGQLPLWIHNPTRPGHDCLNLYRPTIHRVHFIDRKCNETFGFICESSLAPVYKIETHELNDRLYTFYSMKVDWSTAREICQSNGTYLAVMTSPEEAQFITKVGRGFSSLWIGGHVTNRGRIWEHTGEVISSPTEEYLNRPATKSERDLKCISIMQGPENVPYLNETLCNTTLAFVCEEQGDEGQIHVESYTFNNQVYTISTKKVTWDEAVELCYHNGTRLAVFSTQNEADSFNTISRRYHDLWVGGRRVNGKWIWKYTNKEILTSKDFLPETKFNNTVAEEDRCLNLYRDTSTKSYLIDKPCSKVHGFICEGTPVMPGPVTHVVNFSGRKYSFHTKLTSWFDSVTSCSSRGGYLAIIDDLEEAKAIVGMDKQFHDLWIGGRMFGEHWVWEHTEKTIPLVPDQTTLYPPWVRFPNRTNYDCLNLLTVDGEPMFVDRRCIELHGYVCEEVGLKNDTKIIKKFGGHRYVFVAKPVKWHVAVESCRAMHGYLAIISDSKELRFIVDGSQDFHDLWVGGHAVNSQWEWYHTGGKIVVPPIHTSDNDNQSIANGQFLPWLRFPARPMHDCLNVYRDNSNKPFFIDKICTELYAYVCENVPEKIISSHQVKYFRNHRYELSQNQISWGEALHVCQSLGGYLTIIDNAEEAAFLASASKELSDAWIGATYKDNSSWQWSHTGQEIYTLNNVMPFVNPITRPSHDCASLFHDGFNKVMLVDHQCGQRFGYICEETNESEHVAEVFEFHGRHYAFNSKAVTWEEASNICADDGSYLAIVESLEEAQFFVNVSRSYHDLWVGGWFHNSKWEWKHTGQVIPHKSDSLFPPWIHYPTRQQHDCLNIYRDSNNDPHFVDRKCSEKHAFVCEEANEIKNGHQQKLEHRGRSYLFSSEKKTWDEAAETCRHSGSYLAEVGDYEEALFFTKAGRDFHDMWVGGQLDHESWKWDHTGQIISDSLPWAHNVTRPEHDCLNMFRSKNHEPLLIDHRCNHTHGYVCEEANNSEEDEDAIKTLMVDDYLFIFHSRRVTWNEAFNICAQNESSLPVVTEMKIAVLLISAGKEYHDIWLGGHFEDSVWLWKPKNRNIITNHGDGKFTNWIETSPRVDHDCLSLYRDNEGRPIFIDRPCEEKHVFVCQKDIIVGEKTEVLVYGDHIFTLVKRPEEWSDAYDICSRNGSYLSIITDESTSRFLAENINSSSELWIGGHRLKEHWRWELLGEPIVDARSENGFPVWMSDKLHSDQQCLALNLEIKNQPKFSPEECSSSRPFLCDKGCPPLKTVKRGKWSRPDCTSRVAIQNETCSVTCSFGFELWGSRILTCRKNGWSGTFPICVTTDRMANAFVERLNTTIQTLPDLKERSKTECKQLLFVVCKTKTLGGDNFFSILELIKSVVAAVRLLPNHVTAGVITFGNEGEVNIPLNSSDTCEFLEMVNFVAYNNTSEGVDFKLTLSFVHDYITGIHHGNSKSTVIVLVTDSNSVTDAIDVASKLEAEGHYLFTLGIGDKVKSEEIEKISISPDGPFKPANFFLLPDDETFSNFVMYLNDTYLYSGDIECCITLHKQAHGTWNPPSCSEKPGVLNSSCNIVCDLGYELVGNPSLTCTEEGWSGPLGRGLIPSCNSAEVTARSMFDSMDDTLSMLDTVGILFLLDQSSSLSASDFHKQMAFVKMIVSKFSLSESRTAGLITFSTQAQVVVPLNTSDTCTFLMGLEDITFQGGSTSFTAALQAAENEINNHAIHGTTLIFLITDGRSYGNPKKVADRIKSDGNLIFTFGVGGYNHRQLESIASRGPNKKPNSFGVSDFSALKNAISFLKSTYLKSSEKHCCMRLKAQISGVWDPPRCSAFPSAEQEECTLTCDAGYELYGSSKLTCTQEGWSTTTASCFAKADIMAELITDHIRSMLRNLKKPAALLFVLEQTEKMRRYRFSIITNFVKHIIMKFPLSPNQTGGLIVGYKTKAETEVTLDTDDTCKYINQLKNIKIHEGSPSLGRVFKLTLKTTKAYGLNENTAIVLLTDRKYISRSSQNLARKVKDSKPLFLIGIGNREARDDLLVMAANHGKFPIYTVPGNLMILDSYDTLEAITDQLAMPEKLQSWYEKSGYFTPKC